VTLILRDIEGLSTAETAAALEISEASVKSRLHRARAILRQHLGALLAADE
jgi:RNA polymerase sigma-70 factor (ECF subfamily)